MYIAFLSDDKIQEIDNEEEEKVRISQQDFFESKQEHLKSLESDKNIFTDSIY